MAYNKITLNGETKIDLTQDTVTAEDVVAGKTFHLNSGETAVGTLEVSSGGGEFFDRTFANNTPEQIAQVSALISYNNMTSEQVASTYGWNIGDTISYQLTTGENVEMRIIGFNHDNKSDGRGTAGITLQTVNLLRTKYSMNSSNTNAGGYPASKIKLQTLPAIKATLPQEWQNVIKMVDKKSANGGGSNYSEIVTTSEDLFLLSELEVFATVTKAQNGGHEGKAYEYWINNDSNPARTKKYDANNDGVPETGDMWWLRSSVNKYTDYFCIVSTSGGASYDDAKNARGVSFAFCI